MSTKWLEAMSRQLSWKSKHKSAPDESKAAGSKCHDDMAGSEINLANCEKKAKTNKAKMVESSEAGTIEINMDDTELDEHKMAGSDVKAAELKEARYEMKASESKGTSNEWETAHREA